MNEHLPRPRREPTQAAEGLPRWRWTLAEFDRLIELGILTEDDRVELIGGELIPMASKGIRHENVKGEIELWFYDNAPKSTRVMIELGWRPDGETYCEPGVLVFPRQIKPVSKLTPADVLLLVEIADSSWKCDTATKAPLYARLGVREYWVIDATTLETRVHRNPAADGTYGSVTTCAPASRLTPALVPELVLCLAEIEAGAPD